VTKAGLTDVEGQDKKNKSSMATETKETIGVRYLIKAQETVSEPAAGVFRSAKGKSKFHEGGEETR
jgi:hypothetical protein